MHFLTPFFFLYPTPDLLRTIRHYYFIVEAINDEIIPGHDHETASVTIV